MDVPAACLQEITRLKLTRLLQPTQFGVGVPAGAESMVPRGRVFAAMCPHVAHASFDIRMLLERSRVLKSWRWLLQSCQNLRRSSWGFGGSTGTPTHVIRLLDGLFQGDSLSTALFCLGLRRALRRFEGSMREVGLLEPGAQLVHMEYVDDILMNLLPSSAPVWLPLLRDALASVRLSLSLPKFKVLIPAALQPTPNAAIAAAGLTQVFGQLELLGSSMDGVHAACISSWVQSEVLELPAPRGSAWRRP